LNSHAQSSDPSIKTRNCKTHKTRQITATKQNNNINQAKQTKGKTATKQQAANHTNKQCNQARQTTGNQITQTTATKRRKQKANVQQASQTNSRQARKQNKQSEKANVGCSGDLLLGKAVHFVPKYHVQQWKQRAEIVCKTNSYLFSGREFEMSIAQKSLGVS
jgi:cation transport ATPase